MAHPVKVDGEFFLIPGGHLELAEKTYVTGKQRIDYSGLKTFIASQRIQGVTPLPHLIEEIGYVDFDTMEQTESTEIVYHGKYREIARSQHTR